MLIPTAVGINTAGQLTGPSTTSWLLPLDLHQVSTIAPALPGATGGDITRQLTLADLGTDCPHTADPTAIATMVDSRCDPVLAAPTQVREWAYPCNACGRFGLFDPPYAVPTLTGGLIEPTSTVVVTVVPPPTTSAGVAQTPTSTGTSPAAVTGTAGSSAGGSGGGGAGSIAGAASSGTGVTGAADPGATASVVGSGSVGASGTAAPSVTAAGARAVVGEGVAGMWWVPGLSVVFVMFWL